MPSSANPASIAIRSGKLPPTSVSAVADTYDTPRDNALVDSPFFVEGNGKLRGGTIQSVINQLVTKLASTTQSVPTSWTGASLIGCTDLGPWADFSPVNGGVGNVQTMLDKIVDQLGATTGSQKIGRPAVSGFPISYFAGSVGNQMDALITHLNIRATQIDTSIATSMGPTLNTATTGLSFPFMNSYLKSAGPRLIIFYKANGGPAFTSTLDGVNFYTQALCGVNDLGDVIYGDALDGVPGNYIITWSTATGEVRRTNTYGSSWVAGGSSSTNLTVGNYINNTFILAGLGKVYTCQNGTLWVNRTIPGGWNLNTPRQIVVGDNEALIIPDGNADNRFLRTAASFPVSYHVTGGYPSLSGASFRAVSFNSAQQKWIAFTTLPACATSSDGGMTWVAAGTPPTTIIGAASLGSIWVLTGQDGKVYTTPDGVTYTEAQAYPSEVSSFFTSVMRHHKSIYLSRRNNSNQVEYRISNRNPNDGGIGD